jgi:hypothetical protein
MPFQMKRPVVTSVEEPRGRQVPWLFLFEDTGGMPETILLRLPHGALQTHGEFPQDLAFCPCKNGYPPESESKKDTGYERVTVERGLHHRPDPLGPQPGNGEVA